jgi:SAM-dependent methyltransferase
VVSVAKRIGFRRHLFQGRLWFDRLPDRLLGIDTAGKISTAVLGWGPDRGNRYEASPWRTLSTILPRSSVSGRDVFIDLGCGKGRVLLQAARYPFGRVIGVELSPQIAEVARKNAVRVRRHLACKNVEVLVGDLAEFQIPDDVTVAFCFNPAEGEVFRRLLDSLDASLERRPREIRLVYHNPELHDAVREHGWQELRSISLRRADAPCAMKLYRREKR